MTKQKKIEPLVNKELISKVKELGNLSRAEKAKACGYFSVTKSGVERINMKQFLNALIDAKDVEVNGNGKVNEEHESSTSYPIAAQAGRSTDSNKVITVIRANKPTVKPPLPSPSIQKAEIKSVTKPDIQQSEAQQSEAQQDIELPEPLEPVVYLETLAEPPRDESVYGSGWSLAELMDEFAGRGFSSYAF